MIPKIEDALSKIGQLSEHVYSFNYEADIETLKRKMANLSSSVSEKVDCDTFDS